MEKKEIRARVIERRKQLAAEEITERSARICARILETDAFEKAETVYVYMDCKGEVSTKPLIEAAWKMGKKVAAPRVQGDEMAYYYIDSYQDVAPGYFGIPEPVSSCEEAHDEGALKALAEKYSPGLDATAEIAGGLARVAIIELTVERLTGKQAKELV